MPRTLASRWSRSPTGSRLVGGHRAPAGDRRAPGSRARAGLADAAALGGTGPAALRGAYAPEVQALLPVRARKAARRDGDEEGIRPGRRRSVGDPGETE